MDYTLAGNRFVDNLDSSSEVTHVFDWPLSARFVRLTMIEFVVYGGLIWVIRGSPLCLISIYFSIEIRGTYTEDQDIQL